MIRDVQSGVEDRIDLRRATLSDLDALSRLLVQLYAHELPGMLTGPINGQIELAKRLLHSAPLGRRYVLEHDGAVVGMGALATRDEPRPDVPARVLLGAPAVMGPLHGLRSLLGAVRGVLTIAPPPGPDAGQIHSLVVDEAHRGRGLGAVLLRHLEREAARLGKRRAVLQVIEANATARAFYRSAGYAEAPLRGRRLAYPSVLMQRALA